MLPRDQKTRFFAKHCFEKTYQQFPYSIEKVYYKTRENDRELA